MDAPPQSPAEGAPVTAVIVTYFSADKIGPALAALKGGWERGLLKCVVVDNKSEDGTADLVASEHPWVKLIRSPDNVGYGKGCNLGFEQVDTPYVLFLNPDLVIHPDAIARMLDFMKRQPKVGLVGPATRFGGDQYQHAGGLPTPWKVIAQAAGLKSGWAGRIIVMPGAAPTQVDWLCGAIMLLPSEVFRKIGGFDRRFFLYFEETDLCLRIQQAGFELWTIGEAEADHSGGSSARRVDPALENGGCLPAHYYPSRYYYMIKHYGLISAFAAETLELILKAGRDLARRLLFKPSKRELGVRLRGPVFSRPPKVG